MTEVLMSREPGCRCELRVETPEAGEPTVVRDVRPLCLLHGPVDAAVDAAVLAAMEFAATLPELQDVPPERVARMVRAALARFVSE